VGIKYEACYVSPTKHAQKACRILHHHTLKSQCSELYPKASENERMRMLKARINLDI
jgi:hypothetical protein